MRSARENWERRRRRRPPRFAQRRAQNAASSHKRRPATVSTTFSTTSRTAMTSPPPRMSGTASAWMGVGSLRMKGGAVSVLRERRLAARSRYAAQGFNPFGNARPQHTTNSSRPAEVLDGLDERRHHAQLFERAHLGALPRAVSRLTSQSIGMSMRRSGGFWGWALLLWQSFPRVNISHKKTAQNNKSKTHSAPPLLL